MSLKLIKGKSFSTKNKEENSSSSAWLHNLGWWSSLSGFIKNHSEKTENEENTLINKKNL